MTTRVFIIADSTSAQQPDVHVHIEMRNQHGHFRHSRTEILKPSGAGRHMAEIWLHDGCQLIIHEAPLNGDMPKHDDPGHHRPTLEIGGAVQVTHEDPTAQAAHDPNPSALVTQGSDVV